MSTPAAEPTPQIPALNLFSLKGKNAFVTGGSRGIGAAIAIALADAGASVCIAQRDTTNTDTADAIRARGVKAEIIPCDLGDMDAVKGVFQQALDVMDGRIDILVNCGGILKRKEALSVSEEEWDVVMDVNLKALFFLCQAAGRHMVPRRSGKMVNIASINSFIGGENYAPYSSSKGGVSQLTKALSNEWAKHNVQVNAIAPGYVATDMNTALRPNAEVTAAAITGCPAGRWGTPADYAGPAVFLCSNASQYVTGEVLVDTDSDSAYSVGAVTDTESLRSSILDYKWENGRRYHSYGDGTYWGPNDDRQQEAEDLIHELFRIVLDGKLYKAPIGDRPQDVLDIGCGTGIWAIEMADMHPGAEVVGVDLSPIQPNFVPPNCKFEVDDINKDWTFPENKFDFIHIRYMTGTVPDWTELLKKVQKHLKPGGWVEHVELWGDARSDDETLTPESPLKTWVKIFNEVGEKINRPFFWNPVDPFKEAGFTNITEDKVKVPIGTWPKDKNLKQWGAWNRQFLLQGLEGFSIRSLTELLGWEYEKAQMFLVDMRKEILSRDVHSYVLVTTVYGQKPEA